MARDRSYPTPQVKKLQTTDEELESIRFNAAKAQELLDNIYLMTYLDNAKRSILDQTAQQLIYDETIEKTTNGIKSTIKIPASKEYTLMAGEFRFVERLIADLHRTIAIAQETNDMLKNEQLEVAIPNDD